MRSKLKSVLVCFLSLLLLFACSACSSYVVDPSGNGGGGSSTPGVTEPSDPSEDEDPTAFTVKLRTETSGMFYLSANQTLYARWTDTESGNNAYHEARFNSNGVATISGLDGEYRVTLSSLPNGYTYDANGYEVDNNHRDAEIVLLALTPTTGAGTGWYYGNLIEIPSEGTYRATLTRDNYIKGVHFGFTPTASGKYSVESLMDITANKLNPILDTYNGTFANVVETSKKTVDGGGAENTYTKNFYAVMEIAPGKLGNSFFFCVRATVIDQSAEDNIFPLDVDFTLQKEGSFEKEEDGITRVMIPEHDFEAAEADSATFADQIGAAQQYSLYDGNNGVLDGSKVALHEDGYYHLCRKENGAIVSWGPKIYAQLTTANPCINEASGFMHGEVSAPYKIDGGYELTYDETANKYVKTKIYYDYRAFIKSEDYETNSYKAEGYCKYASLHGGVYPVTKELKEFLQRYSVHSRYFNDGQGNAEVSAGLSSSHNNQWLFACVYYPDALSGGWTTVD